MPWCGARPSGPERQSDVRRGLLPLQSSDGHSQAHQGPRGGFYEVQVDEGHARVRDTKALAILREACRRRNYGLRSSGCLPRLSVMDGLDPGRTWKPLSYAEMDTPEMLQEWFELDLARVRD